MCVSDRLDEMQCRWAQNPPTRDENMDMSKDRRTVKDTDIQTPDGSYLQGAARRKSPAWTNCQDKSAHV